MSKLPRFDVILPYYRTSIFPPEIQARFRKLSVWPKEPAEAGDVEALVDAVSQLPPSSILAVAEEICTLAEFYSRGSIVSGDGRIRFVKSLETKGLKTTELLEYLYVFHGDGYMREAALLKIDRPLPGPFYVAAVAYRLNDWASPVRDAARTCLGRVLGKTDSEFIAEAGLYLLHQMWLWRRAGDHLDTLRDALSAPRVIAALTNRLQSETTGPLARTLRYALRPLTVKADLAGRLETAANDRATNIRKLAAQKLIEHRRELPDMSKTANKLLHDKSPAVRERAEYYLRKMDLQPEAST
ncbi:MAG: hypothetical protein ACR2OM_09990 [Aestuariivirgaceae bacterium]